jgi:hypothetical protein
MAAETEQARLIKQARLHLSPAEVVFEEFQKQAQRSRYEWFYYDDKKIRRRQATERVNLLSRIVCERNVRTCPAI